MSKMGILFNISVNNIPYAHPKYQVIAPPMAIVFEILCLAPHIVCRVPLAKIYL
jgi:hypothetical protein